MRQIESPDLHILQTYSALCKLPGQSLNLKKSKDTSVYIKPALLRDTIYRCKKKVNLLENKPYTGTAFAN